MNSLSQDFSTGLLDRCEPPCLTLCQPTHRHHPEKQQDRIRYRNLVKSLEASLRRRYPARDAEPLLAPFRALEADDDFWIRTRDGIAVVGARDVFRVYRLQRSVPELAIVADSCHTKPLIRQLQTTDRYQAIGVSRSGVRLFEGNRDVLDEIEPAPQVLEAIADAKNREGLEPHLSFSSYAVGRGQRAAFHGHGARELESDAEAERVFRAVDRAVIDHHSQPSGLPLILVSLPENGALFRRLSRNPALLADGVDLHPDALSIDEVREQTWRVLEPHYTARLAGLAEGWTAARAHGTASESLDDIGRALAESRVATLLIEAERQVPGRVDEQTGAVSRDVDLEDPRVDDLLDDLGAFAVRRGAEVVVMPPEYMPTKTGAAAIHRF